MVRRSNSLLNPDYIRVTPEFASVLHFLDKYPYLDSWASHVSYASSTAIKRVQASDVVALKSALAEGEGHPVLVTDATNGWNAPKAWTLDTFKRLGGNISVVVNDRAPARHADVLPGAGGPQNSIQLRLSEYINYVEQLPETLNGLNTNACSTPFYLNGWKALLDIPALAQDCPALPTFAEPLDDTLSLLAAVDAQLFHTQSRDTAATWCKQVDDNLRKVFISPPGALTRLHYDAGSAHGWLAQISGRKLFILVPPSKTQNLHPLPTEIETVQSPIDPLKPDVKRWPEWAEARPMACIVEPGEAVVVPQGWWHYAVALDRSITLQRNFYNAGTNADGLVKMVLKSMASLKEKKHGGQPTTDKR